MEIVASREVEALSDTWTAETAFGIRTPKLTTHVRASRQDTHDELRRAAATRARLQRINLNHPTPPIPGEDRLFPHRRSLPFPTVAIEQSASNSRASRSSRRTALSCLNHSKLCQNKCLNLAIIRPRCWHIELSSARGLEHPAWTKVRPDWNQMHQVSGYPDTQLPKTQVDPYPSCQITTLAVP